MESAGCVGRRIRAIRKRRGLTQEQLAARIERSAETVSALERGRNMPTLGILRRLAVALDVPIRDFFAPAGGGEAESPKHAALFSELLADARTLPLAELEMTVGIVGVVARRHGG
jgi:transcriptional regulator with XRE-family HTH domain